MRALGIVLAWIADGAYQLGNALNVASVHLLDRTVGEVLP